MRLPFTLARERGLLFWGVALCFLTFLTGCATENKWPGIGATRSGPEVGCPPIMSPYGDYWSNYGKHPRAANVANPAIDHPHSGIDIDVPVGTEVLAAAPGVISGIRWNTYWKNSESLGTRVVVYHGQDSDGMHIFTTYLHLSKRLKEPGTVVKRGEVIALSGTGGGAAHLHLSLWRLPVGPRFSGSIPMQGPAIQQHFETAVNTRQQALIYEDPALYWLNPKNPSFTASRDYQDLPIRLTYPVVCKQK
jgi:murein DD-endopeptidase MepM/ murein hydrolase activator NlpD